MKLPIISEDAGAKIACGRGTGNYYIISDGLIMSYINSFSDIHLFKVSTSYTHAHILFAIYDQTSLPSIGFSRYKLEDRFS